MYTSSVKEEKTEDILKPMPFNFVKSVENNKGSIGLKPDLTVNPFDFDQKRLDSDKWFLEEATDLVDIYPIGSVFAVMPLMYYSTVEKHYIQSNGRYRVNKDGSYIHTYHPIPDKFIVTSEQYDVMGKNYAGIVPVEVDGISTKYAELFGYKKNKKFLAYLKNSPYNCTTFNFQ